MNLRFYQGDTLTRNGMEPDKTLGPTEMNKKKETYITFIQMNK